MKWWQGRKGHNRVIIAAFGGLAALAIVLTGIFGYLFGGDSRQIVVTMAVGITEADRVLVKQDCGHLPGVSIVADRGPAAKQFDLPVRFNVSNSTTAQESALYDCLNRHPTLVRGVETERLD